MASILYNQLTNSLFLPFFGSISPWTATAVQLKNDGGFLNTWDTENECNFFNATYKYENGICSHFSTGKLNIATISESIDRAMRCAALYETDCIISPEVGLNVPAAYVYDAELGFKMLLSPKRINEKNETVKIAVHTPLYTTNPVFMFEHNITVEYTDPKHRRVVTESFVGPQSFCIQLLFEAFDDACWNDIWV